MGSKNSILMLAGHVDHGKTALVEALTGGDLDRLPEEKKRGLTIDLGFTVLDLPEIQHRLGIIDVPGHADFIKNMVAGTSGVDMGLLVVAADDGWMPQTEEHFQILTYLGIRSLIIAITKSDIDEELTAFVAEQVCEELVGTPYEGASIVPVSALKETGLSSLRAALAEELSRMPEPGGLEHARMFIDRVFKMPGQGRVATGTLEGGSFREGQLLTWYPFTESLRVRSLQNHGEDQPEVGPGSRVAINLSTLAGTKHSAEDLARGQLLIDEETFETTQIIDVLLTRSDRVDYMPKKNSRALRHDTRVRLHIGSNKITAQLILLGVSELRPGEKALARLKLEKPFVFFLGDRFLIRDWSEQATMCGGIVLDQLPPKNMSPRKGSQKVYLDTLAETNLGPRDFLLALLKRDQCLDGRKIESRFVISRDALSKIYKREEEAGLLLVLGDWLVEKAFWKQQLGSIKEQALLYHRENPQEFGLPLTSLKQCAIPLHLFSRALERDDYSIEDAVIRKNDHAPHLTKSLEELEVEILRALEGNGESPVEIFSDTKDKDRVLKYLLQKRAIIRISENAYLLGKTYEQKIRRGVLFLKENGPSRVSEIRDAAQLSRKYLVPFLEALDKERITMRSGDLRSLANTARNPDS